MLKDVKEEFSEKFKEKRGNTCGFKKSKCNT
jgi:hypothetical protein